MNSIEPLIGTLVLVTTQAKKMAKPIESDVRMTAKMKVFAKDGTILGSAKAV
jgi:hypothetical protein